MEPNKSIATIGALVVSVHVLGAEPTHDPPTCSLEIEAQPLDGALQEVARECGANLLYLSAITAGLTGGPLRGRYTLDEALHHLLDGTDLLFSHTDPLTIRIQHDGARDQAARAHTGDARAPDFTTARPATELDEISVIATAQGFVATRIDTPLRDIPQTISIISAEQIQQENVFTVNDALSKAVGITSMQSGTGLLTFYSRGLQITNFTLDGGGSFNGFTNFAVGYFLLTPDLAEFDHIEVLRGSNALFGADSPPGGEINLVRKRPLDTPQLLSTTSAGSWNNYRQELDATGPIALDGALRGRVDVSYAHRDFFYKLSYQELKSAFGAVEWDLSSATRLTAGGSYSSDHSLPFYGGFPLLSNGSEPDLPVDTAYTFDWARLNTEAREAYLQLEQTFGARWRLNVNATLLNQTMDYALGAFYGPIDPRTGDIGQPFAEYTIGPSRQNQFNLEATLTGSAHWQGLFEQFALGADFHRSRYSTLDGLAFGFGPLEANAYSFNPADYPDPRSDPAETGAGPIYTESRTISVAGLFGSLRIKFDQRWWVTLGLRVSDERPELDDRFLQPPAEVHLRFLYNNILSPFAAAQLSINDTYSLYASYADIYFSNNGAAYSNGDLLKPSQGITIETGLKGAWRDGALNGSIALFSVLEKGIGVIDFTTSYTLQFPNVDCCYNSYGRNSSKGVDLELAGRPTQNWSIGAGYTANTVNQGNSANQIIEPLTGYTPRHLLKVWSSVTLPGAWSRWSVGGSLLASSSTYNDTIALVEDQKAYVVVSPRFDFQLHPQWRVSFTASNVFNQRYYQGGIGDFYGEPRGFLARLDGHF